MPKESVLVTKILKKLRADRPEAFFVKIPGTRFNAGMPDIVGCVDGRFVAIEVKRPDTSYGLTKRQVVILAMILRAGGRAGVARSVEDARAIVTGEKQGIDGE